MNEPTCCSIFFQICSQSSLISCALLYATAKNSEATNPPVEDAENRNNRDLVDDNTAQTLSADDIENMRRYMDCFASGNFRN